MAAFFGEILPVVSRAAVDVEDDELAPQPKPLIIQKTLLGKEQPSSCECLIVTVGDVAWRFVESFFDLSIENKLADIEETPDDDQGGFEAISKLPKTVVSFYRVSKGDRTTVFAACKSYTPPEQIWPQANEIMDFMKGYSEVFVLSSSPVQEYKCDDPSLLEAPMVKSLSSAKPPIGHPVSAKLDQPNMFKNIVAAVLSKCLIRQISAVAYVCYTDNIRLDCSSVLAFRHLLETPQFNSTKTFEIAVKEIMHSVRNSNARHDGLYT